MALPRKETAQFLLHPLYLLAYTLTLAATSRLTDTLSSSQSAFIVVSVVLLRSAGCVTLPSLPIILRPAVTYLAGLLGVLVAKFTETSLIQPDVMPMIINSSSGLPNPQLPLQTNSNGGGSGGGSLSGSRRTSAVDHESRVMAARRRRTSSAALTSTQASAATSVATGQSGATQGGTTGNNKVRRTSLPALLANKKDNLLVSVSPSINSIRLLSCSAFSLSPVNQQAILPVVRCRVHRKRKFTIHSQQFCRPRLCFLFWFRFCL